jgi:multiple sugar transport system ATP-binding protein
VVGIRPEGLQPGTAAGISFDPLLEVVEPVGNEICLNLRHESSRGSRQT